MGQKAFGGVKRRRGESLCRHETPDGTVLCHVADELEMSEDRGTPHIPQTSSKITPKWVPLFSETPESIQVWLRVGFHSLKCNQLSPWISS